MKSKTLTHARQLWNYLYTFHSSEGKIQNSEAIVVCCSYDLRVCDFACDLQKKYNVAPLVFSGKTGNWTKHLWDCAEAHVFKERAVGNDVPLSTLIVEDKATNIGENIGFSKELILDAKTVTFITKPNTMLRVLLALPVHWPEVTGYVACPTISFPEEISSVIGLLGLINEMVGDIQRILEYPGQGFQVVHKFPPEILESYHFLKKNGFDLHCIR